MRSQTDKPVLILQQLACEPPALLADLLHETGWKTERLLVQEQQIPADLDAYAGMIVMGGPMSAKDSHLNYIASELALLQQAIARDFPVLGICLGAQLLAKAAGATILPAPERELGWYPLLPSSSACNDSLFRYLKDNIKVFQWHGETFDLPAKATHLASCRHVPNQAFRLGSRQYGLQFHIEVDAAIICNWVKLCDSERNALGTKGVACMLNETPALITQAHTFCRQIIEAWVLLL